MTLSSFNYYGPGRESTGSLGPPGLPLSSFRIPFLPAIPQSVCRLVVDTFTGCLSLLQPAVSTHYAPFPGAHGWPKEEAVAQQGSTHWAMSVSTLPAGRYQSSL